jgi:hypothetical protein
MTFKTFDRAADAGADLENLVVRRQERRELAVDPLTISPGPHHPPSRRSALAVVFVAIARRVELIELLVARDVPMRDQPAG